MKGRTSCTLRAMTFSLTCRPALTFCTSRRMASAQRNASGSDSRRLAESSSVRSSHCAEAVRGALTERVMRYRLSEQMRSHRMGLRLYAMAEEPICMLSKGSSSWRSC